MASPTVVVSVLGLSRLDGENFSSHQGIGKSCLCYRFMYPGYDDYVEDHRSLLALHEFESDVVHKDHFLYWGSTTRTCGAKEKMHFEVMEYTVFYEDIMDQPFRSSNKKPVTSLEGYMKMAIGSPLESPGKISYKNRDLICSPQDYESLLFPPGIGKHPRGYVVVIDVSDSGPKFESRLCMTKNMVAHLAKKNQKFVVAATKRDEAFTTSLEKLSELARTSKFTLIEVSAKSNVNVSEAFEIVAAKVLRKVVQGIPNQVLSYQDAAKKTLSNRDKARRAFRAYLQKRVTLASERLKAIECTEEYKECAHLHGKFETDKMFTQHVLMVRNDEVSCYAGVMENVEMRQEFLEDYVSDRTDLSLYSNYLKDLITRICQKCSNESPPMTSPLLPDPQYDEGSKGDNLVSNDGDRQKPDGRYTKVTCVSGGEEGQDEGDKEDKEDDDNYVPVNDEEEDDTAGNNSDDYEHMAGGEDTSDDEGRDYVNMPGGLGTGAQSQQPSAQEEKEEEEMEQVKVEQPLDKPFTPSSVVGVDLSRSRGIQDQGNQAGQGGSPAPQPKKGPPPPLKIKPPPPMRSVSLPTPDPDPSKKGANDPGTMTKPRDGNTTPKTTEAEPEFEPGNSKEPLTTPSVMSPVTAPSTENMDKPLLRQIREKLEKDKERAKNQPPNPPVPSPKPDRFLPSSPAMAPPKTSSPPAVTTPTSLRPGQVYDPTSTSAPPSRPPPTAPRFGRVSDAAATLPFLPVSEDPPLKPPATSTYPLPVSADPPLRFQAISPRFGQASEPTVTPTYPLPILTDPSSRPPAAPPRPSGAIDVSAPIPLSTTVQLRGPSLTNPPPDPPSPARKASSPSPPPPLCQIARKAYELVKKKFTGKSSVDESMARQPSMELIQEPSTFENSRKTTFIDMKKRPLPPEPSPNSGGHVGGHVGGHGNDSDEDLHDYERVEEGSPAMAAWKLQKPLVADVRRAKSFNSATQKRCDNGDYENEGERPRPPEPLPPPPLSSSPSDDDKLDYDYPRIPGAMPPTTKRKPVPPRRVKLDSMSPSPRHAPGIPADGIRAANSMDSYMNADGLGDGDDNFASLDDSYVNLASEESHLHGTKPHSHSAEDLSVYMNLPLPSPAFSRPPTASLAAPFVANTVKPVSPPIVNPRPRRAQANVIPTVPVGATLPRATQDTLSSSLPVKGLRNQAQRAPGVVTRALPPRNVIRK
ncbi:hypothetical protein EMCRGX_G034772 [Ephydatia muelleri]